MEGFKNIWKELRKCGRFYESLAGFKDDFMEVWKDLRIYGRI